MLAFKMLVVFGLYLLLKLLQGRQLLFSKFNVRYLRHSRFLVGIVSLDLFFVDVRVFQVS